MVEVEVFRKHKEVTGLKVTGHADFSLKGTDIVCAGVSTLLLTMLKGIDRFVNIRLKGEIYPGYFEVKFPDNLDEKAYDRLQIIVGTAILGLKEMSLEYPENISYNESGEYR